MRDQLRRVTNGASELGRYDYDAERRRLTRSTAGGALLYVYDGAEVVEESGWDAATQRTTQLNRYEHGLEIVKAKLAGEGERYYFSEGQGSVTMLATTGNALAQRTEYEAWGEVLSQTNSSVNAVGYTGARRDNESGLLALGNGERFYNPALGRFIQQDRWSGIAGMAQTLNWYAYGVNNPVRWTDHSGNSPDGMSASDATRIGGGESSAGEFRADSQLVDDSYARGMAQQNAGRSYEENASEVPFTQIMREQTQARMFEAQVVISHTIVKTAFGIASPMLKNPLAQALAGRAEEYIHQQIDFELGVEGAQPPSIRDLVIGIGRDFLRDLVIGKTIEYAAKGVGKVAEKVKEKVKGKAIGAAESAVRQETRSLTGGGKGNGSGGSEHGNGGGGGGESARIRANPEEIRFTQPTVSPNFSDGRTITGTVKELKLDPSLAERIDPIRVFEKNGKLYSIDNRRLVAFQTAGIKDIPIIKVDLTKDADLAEKVSKRFETVEDGMKIVVAPAKEQASAKKLLRQYGKTSKN